MALSAPEVYERLVRAARTNDAVLAIDRGSVHWRDGSYPGVEFSLTLRGAHALLFLPSDDVAGPEWEDRLAQRLEAARRYLLGYPDRSR